MINSLFFRLLAWATFTIALLLVFYSWRTFGEALFHMGTMHC